VHSSDISRLEKVCGTGDSLDASLDACVDAFPDACLDALHSCQARRTLTCSGHGRQLGWDPLLKWPMGQGAQVLSVSVLLIAVPSAQINSWAIV
jgi:hypothetical protein